MANFDTCERINKAAMADPNPDFAAVAERIYNLSNTEKVTMYRGRTAAEIEAQLTRAHAALRAPFPNGFRFVASEDNTVGKDITETFSRTEIELKSGLAMTDASLGLRVVSWALGDDNHELRGILSPKGRRAELLRAQTAGTDPSVAVERYKSDAMNRLHHLFARLAPDGQPAPLKLAHLFRAVADGHTSEATIKRSFAACTARPLLLVADWDNGLVRYSKSFDPTEDLIVTSSRTGSRAQLEVVGSVSGRSAVLYPNYKNSWKGFPAANWVSSPCFHIYVS